MPTGRKIRDARDAETCLSAVAVSRLPLRDWAHQNGVDARSLNAWRVNRAPRQRTTPAGPGPRLVELVTAPPPAQRAPLRILLRDVVIEVPPGFDVLQLRELVKVLREC